MRAHSKYYMDATENNNKGNITEEINSFKKKTFHLVSYKFSKIMYEYQIHFNQN